MFSAEPPPPPSLNTLAEHQRQQDRSLRQAARQPRLPVRPILSRFQRTTNGAPQIRRHLAQGSVLRTGYRTGRVRTPFHRSYRTNSSSTGSIVTLDRNL